MRYSVIIATWNAFDALRDCLESVADQRLDGPLETIVVDDASTDGTPELLAGFGKRMRTIRTEVKLGYSAGINRGAEAATGDVIFIVNSDTVLRPESLQRLADALRDPAVGLAGPRYSGPTERSSAAARATHGRRRAVDGRAASTGSCPTVPGRASLRCTGPTTGAATSTW